jgi:hypothetical protein
MKRKTTSDEKEANVTPPTMPEDVARAAYEAYGKTTNFKNYQGLPMPKWENLSSKIQAAWIAACREVVDLTTRGYTPDGWGYKK